MGNNTYGCDRCGGRFDWDNEINWISTSIGLCDKCYEEIKTDLYCKNCNTLLCKSDLPEYKYVCYECDENFYGFEQDE